MTFPPNPVEPGTGFFFFRGGLFSFSAEDYSFFRGGFSLTHPGAQDHNDQKSDQ